MDSIGLGMDEVGFATSSRVVATAAQWSNAPRHCLQHRVFRLDGGQ